MWTRTDIRTKVQSLLRQQDLNRAPVDVELLARNLGLAIHYEDLEDDVSGLLVVKDGKGHIIVNKDHHSNRQRFTLAHEIGHYILHETANENGDRLFYDTKFSLYQRANSAHSDTYRSATSTTTPQEEREANTFASEVLMPVDLVTQFVQERNLDTGDEFDIALLASAFRVSEIAMSIRLQEIDLFVSAMVQ